MRPYRLERAGRAGRPERHALASQREFRRREAARRGASVEPRQVERPAAVREEDVRVGARELVHERAQKVLFRAFERRFPDTNRPDAAVGRRDATPPFPDEMDLEPRDAQRRGRVVDRLGRLGRPERGRPADHRGERVEVMREVVELRGTEVDVVEREPLVPPSASTLRARARRAGFRVGTTERTGRFRRSKSDGRSEPRATECTSGWSASRRARRARSLRVPATRKGGRYSTAVRRYATGPPLLRPEDDRTTVVALGDVEEPAVRPRRRRRRRHHQRREVGVGGSARTRTARSVRTERRIDSSRSGLPTYVACAT